MEDSASAAAKYVSNSDHMKSRSAVSLAGILCTTVAAQAIPAQAPVAPACYELFVGPWSSKPEVDSHPPIIRLDTADAGKPFPPGVRRQLSPDIRQPTPGLGFPPSWGEAQGQIYLAWSTGFYGTSIRLEPRGDLLIGEAHSFTDAHRIPEPPAPRAPATAKRVSCPPSLRLPGGAALGSSSR